MEEADQQVHALTYKITEDWNEYYLGNKQLCEGEKERLLIGAREVKEGGDINQSPEGQGWIN